MEVSWFKELKDINPFRKRFIYLFENLSYRKRKRGRNTHRETERQRESIVMVRAVPSQIQ